MYLGLISKTWVFTEAFLSDDVCLFSCVELLRIFKCLFWTLSLYFRDSLERVMVKSPLGWVVIWISWEWLLSFLLKGLEYLPEIVEAACSSSYMVAFEALTVLENLEGPFDEEKISEAKLIINDYFANPHEETKQLISVILGLLNEMDNSLDA